MVSVVRAPCSFGLGFCDVRPLDLASREGRRVCVHPAAAVTEVGSCAWTGAEPLAVLAWVYPQCPGVDMQSRSLGLESQLCCVKFS